MRFSLSLLISINIHVWVFVAGAMVWIRSIPLETPRAVEIEMIKLPAMPEPGKGGEVIKRADPVERVRASGPSVKYRVTVSSTKAFNSRPVPFYESELADLEFLKESADEEMAQHEFMPGSEQDSFEPEKIDDSSDLDPGGDPRPLVKIIQARIDEVTPLIHHTSGSCRFEQGVIKIRFRISLHGYTESKRVYGSSGPVCLQQVAEKILHMAEPYPYVAGWVPVTIKFTL